MALGYLISPVIQIEDINGKPLVGGFVRVYVHGTTIPYITQKNFDGDLNPAEVVLDNKGMCVLLAEAGNLYDVYCEDRNRVEQWSRVNVGVCGGGGGGGSSSYISTIYSSDNSLTIIRTGSTVDIKINRDGDASAMAVFSDPLTADGLFEFNHEPINYSGNDIGLLDGEIICRRRWYHFDATAVLDWHGSSVNSDARINLIGPDVNEYVDFDLSYAHKHSFDVSGVFEIHSDGTAVPFQITGLPQGMSAQLVNVSIHALTVGAGGSGGGPGEFIHDNTLVGDNTLASPAGVNTELIQEKLEAGEGITIEGNTISVTGGQGHTYTGIDPIHINDEDEISLQTSNGLTTDEQGNLVVDTTTIQEKLVPGTGIDITGNTISVVGGGGSGLAEVSHDSTLTGTGTVANPLCVDPTVMQEKLVAGDGISIVNNTISASQVQSDWTENDTTDASYIQNKPANLVQDADYVHTDNNFTDTLKDKLDGVASGAEVNVQSDWNETNSSSDAYILNKPTINNVPPVTSSDNGKVLKAEFSGGVGSYSWETAAASQVQADWAQTDSTAVDYIKNKPTIPSGDQLVPPATSADEDKVLTVDSNGDPTWAPAQGGGGGLDAVAHGNTLTGDGTTSNPLDVNLSTVQEKLVPGSGISITGNVITATGGGAPQVQADWAETDTTDVSYIQNKPAMNNLVAGTGIALSLSDSNIVISATAQPQVQADWAQTDSTAVDYIQNKPNLATVATSGSYNDLNNKPNLATVATSGSYNDLSNKPTLATVATSGSYNDLSNTPTIPSGNQLVPSATSADATKVLTVDNNGVPGWASSGSTGLFIAQYGISTYAEITAAINANRIVYCRVSPSSSTSTLASLAYIGSGYYQFQYYKKLTTHSYSNQGDEVYVYKIASDNTWSVSGGNAYTTIRPGTNMTETYSNGIMTLNVTLPTVDQTYDGTSTNAQSGTAIEGKLANYTPTASLATVATTGAYSDLSGTPTIPAAQVNADWNASSGVAQILNKPTVDQTYNSASANAQSGTAIAGALADKEDAFTVGTGLEMDTTGSIPVLQVSFTQQLLDELKRALGVDETVLWEGSLGTTGIMQNLSESIYNFEAIEVHCWPNKSNITQRAPQVSKFTLPTSTATTFFYCKTQNIESGTYYSEVIYVNVSNGTSFQLAQGHRWQDNTQTKAVDTYRGSVCKIVGICRKENA